MKKFSKFSHNSPSITNKIEEIVFCVFPIITKAVKNISNELKTQKIIMVLL